jgi:hypothetical protein
MNFQTSFIFHFKLLFHMKSCLYAATYELSLQHAPFCCDVNESHDVMIFFETNSKKKFEYFCQNSFLPMSRHAILHFQHEWHHIFKRIFCINFFFMSWHAYSRHDVMISFFKFSFVKMFFLKFVFFQIFSSLHILVCTSHHDLTILFAKKMVMP